MCVLIRERGHLVEAHAVVARRRRRHRVLGHGDGLARVPQTFDQRLDHRLRPDDLRREQLPRLVLPLEALAPPLAVVLEQAEICKLVEHRDPLGGSVEAPRRVQRRDDGLAQVHESASTFVARREGFERVGAVPRVARVRKILTSENFIISDDLEVLLERMDVGTVQMAGLRGVLAEVDDLRGAFPSNRVLMTT